MNLLLQRLHSGPESTVGALYIDGVFHSYTCEDEHRNIKVPGRTRIAAGFYDIVLRAEGGMHGRYDSKFPGLHRGMLWLLDVPGFEWAYIHIGNKHENTSGCILTGADAYTNDQGGSVGRSTLAYESLYRKIIMAIDRGERIRIDVMDEAATARGTTVLLG